MFLTPTAWFDLKSKRSDEHKSPSFHKGMDYVFILSLWASLARPLRQESAYYTISLTRKYRVSRRRSLYRDIVLF